MNSIKKIGFVAVLVSVLGFGLVSTSFAQSETGVNETGGSSSGVNTGVETVTLNNPLRVDSLENLLVAILNIFITLMIPVIVFFIIFAGFKYVTAQGNPGKLEEATATLTYAIIGGVLILAAVAIAEIIKNTVQAF